jgi:hypothetical protein
MCRRSFCTVERRRDGDRSAPSRVDGTPHISPRHPRFRRTESFLPLSLSQIGRSPGEQYLLTGRGDAVVSAPCQRGSSRTSASDRGCRPSLRAETADCRGCLRASVFLSRRECSLRDPCCYKMLYLLQRIQYGSIYIQKRGGIHPFCDNIASVNPCVVMAVGGWDSFQAIEPYLNTPTLTPEIVTTPSRRLDWPEYAETHTESATHPVTSKKSTGSATAAHHFQWYQDSEHTRFEICSALHNTANTPRFRCVTGEIVRYRSSSDRNASHSFHGFNPHSGR